MYWGETARIGYERGAEHLAGLESHYKRLEDLETQGKRSINRSRKENYETRLLAKYGAKSNWYKGRKGSGEIVERGGKGKRGKDRKRRKTVETERQIEAVLFVPATPEGELARLIQEGDDKIREGRGRGDLK